eukprot:5468080-Pyramimonas_sp.AAC.1
MSALPHAGGGSAAWALLLLSLGLPRGQAQLFSCSRGCCRYVSAGVAPRRALSCSFPFSEPPPSWVSDLLGARRALGVHGGYLH